jgi:diguanylate cyclase (GGDEF)-like protein
MCLLVCVGAWVSTKLSLAVGTVSCIWIANGIISAFILTAPQRWKIPFFVAGQLANFGVDFALGNTFYCACWFVVCNSSEVLVTVLSLRHFGGRAEVADRQALWRIACFGLFLGPLTCALLAAPAVQLVEGRPFLEAARIWFLSDALGCAATLPLMLFLLTRERKNARERGTDIVDVAWACLFTAVVVAVFWQTKYPLIFLLFPPVVAVLFRFKLAGAIYGTSLVLVFAAAFTAQGHGPFALSRGAAPAERVMLFQMFGLILFASCVPLGYSIEERHRLEEKLKQANQKLLDLALLDPLTSVCNRRGFEIVMESAWSGARATGTDVSLIYLDLDFFKRFNDSYGHQVGDDCLRSVAGSLVDSVRGARDCVARYGGEEFVILLPGTSADSARATADRVAAAIMDLRIPHRESPFGIVTASLGISTARPGEGNSANGLISQADDGLYAAKRSGRDRIESNCEPEDLPHLIKLA